MFFNGEPALFHGSRFSDLPVAPSWAAAAVASYTLASEFGALDPRVRNDIG